MMEELRILRKVTFRFKDDSTMVVMLVEPKMDSKHYILTDVFNDKGEYQKRYIKYISFKINVAEEDFNEMITELVHSGFVQVSGKLGGIHYEG